MNKWISVEDDLPEPGVYIVYNGYEVRTARRWGDNMPFTWSCNVTHWQPLPNPPKEKTATKL